MKILKTTKTAYERQVWESVKIQKERRQHLMNDKSQWNALPRLTAKLGEKSLEKWSQANHRRRD